MLELIYPYLLSVATTIVVLVVAVIAFSHHRRAAVEYRVKEARLPEACRLEDLTHRVADAEASLADLQAARLDAQHLIDRRELAERWLLENEPRYKELDAQLPTLSATVEATQIEVASLREERNRLSGETAQLQSRRDTLAKELDAAGTLLQQRQDAFDAIEARIVERRQEEASLGVKLSELTARLQSQDEALRTSRTEAAAIEQQIRSSHDRLAKSEQDLALLGQRLEDLKRREAQEQELIRELRKTIDELTKSEQELRRLQKELEQGVEARRANVQKAEAEIARLSASLQQLASAEKDAGAKHTQVRSELQEAIKLRDAANAAHERIKSEIAEAKQHFESLQKRINELSTSLPPGQHANEEDRLAELWSPILVDASQRPQVHQELKALQKAESYIAESGLRFSPRVLNAFHTTLKVADISPLVVLAGISGTGKSELPRRYAEAMGMHFLNIAVQPRWDSPQDMFGFYNYLESRYHATELARALVQMDPFGQMVGRGWQCPKEWPQKHSRREDVLLVLLDEMNLARVEYYFSEFLSRLEVRRGVDRGVAGDRRKAEVPLEVGMGPRAGAANGPLKASATNGALHTPTMQLFIDTNVLFVGTMNEDESTQTLSDKVIDRANVLRFGRPADLRQSPAGSLSQASGAYLSATTWRSWRRDVDELGERQDEVSGWIKKLNEALGLVGRPFAFRTALAMRTYVANYPYPDQYRNAMADQIEFRILPKFRGLELGDVSCKKAISAVIEVVSELQDNVLRDAIRSSTSTARAGEQFVWHGVDRLGMDD